MSDFSDLYRVDKHRILSKEEECELILRYQKTNCISSRNKLIECNMRFIIKCAMGFKNKYHWVHVNDIIGYGVQGFIKSLGKNKQGEWRFDTSLKVRLITHCVFWVRQNIQRGCEDNESGIRVPANQWEMMRKKVKNKEDLNDEQLVWYENAISLNSSDSLIGADGRTLTIAEHYSFINHDKETLHDNNLDVSIREKNINDVIDTLTKSEQEIIRGLFGMHGGDSLTLRHIGNDIGLSHERVRQLKQRAFKKMRIEFKRRGLKIEDYT